MMTLGFIGTTEVVVILIIALLVFGPQKLPEVGRQIGSLYQELNRMRGDVQRALDIDDYTRYDGRDHNTNSYSSGYSYDTPTDHADHGYHADLHDGTTTPLITGSESTPADMVAPPGPAGTVASRSPFAVPSAEADLDAHTTAYEASAPSSDTTAHIYTQPETQGDASTAPPHKEPNQS